MTLLHRIEHAVFRPITWLVDGGLMPTLARFIFLAVLAPFFWASGLTKLGEGLFGFLTPSVGAYAQILPKAMEAVGYDTSQLTTWQHAIVIGGTWAEFLLPALIILGLFTRSASLAMIGFIILMSVVDVTGHGVDATALGALFDRIPDSKVLDQRLLWIFPLLLLVARGGGPLSLDALLGRRRAQVPDEAPIPI